MPTLRPATAIGLVAVAGLLALGGLAARDVWRIRDDVEAGQQSLAGLNLQRVDAEGGLPAVAAKADRRLRADRRARTSL